MRVATNEAVGHRSAAGQHEAEAGEVGARPTVGGGEPLEQARSGEADGDPVPLDEGERPVGFDILGHDDRATHEQHRQDVDPGAADAEERGEGDRDVVVAEFRAGQEVDDVPGHVGVRQHHALRRPVVPVVCGRNSKSSRSTATSESPARRFGDQRFVVHRAGARATHGDPVQHRCRERGLGQRRVLEDDDGIRVGDDGGTLVGWQVVVDGSQDGTDPASREQRLEECRVVLAEPRDPVAMPDAHAPECARESADPLCERGVGPLAVGSDEGGTVRRAPCAPFDPRSDAEVPRAEPLHAGTIDRARIGKRG